MTKSRRKRKRPGAGGLFLVVFGLPFLAVGCFATYRTVALLWRWQEAKGWLEVEARITSVDLEIHTDDDGSTYQAACSYVYEFDGTQYESDRVGLERGGDSIGDWQQTTHERLKIAHEQSQPIPCYVDPARPERAVLFRDLRPKLLGFWVGFAAVFTTAGLAMVVGGAYARRVAAKGEELRARHPRKPWLWKGEWTSGTVRSGTQLKALVSWAAAVFWNGISWPAVTLVVTDAVLSEGRYWMSIFVVFPLIGVWLLVRAVRQTIQHFKFGRSYLQLKTLPGVIGGKLSGDLVLRGRLRALRAVDVALRCVRTVTTGSGDNRSTRKETLWEDTKQFDRLSVFGQNQVSVAVEFQIPEGQRSSSDDIDWVLKATGAVPGVDVDLEFSVPVYKVKRRS